MHSEALLCTPLHPILEDKKHPVLDVNKISSNYGRQERKKHPLLDVENIGRQETSNFGCQQINIIQFWKTRHIQFWMSTNVIQDKKHQVLDDYCTNFLLYREMNNNHPLLDEYNNRPYLDENVRSINIQNWNLTIPGYIWCFYHKIHNCYAVQPH